MKRWLVIVNLGLLISIPYIVVIIVNRFLCNFEKSVTIINDRFLAPAVNRNEIEKYKKGPWLQNDSRILNWIKENGYLKPPPPDNLPYNLQNPFIDPSMGQSQIVKILFQGKRNGFFIECGALDGETRSNTLSLERDFNWKGLLVEADPKNHNLLMTKHRKAWTAGACLSIHPYPHEVIFNQDFNVGKIKSENLEDVPESSNQKSSVRIQCFPLYSLLSAIGVKTVDYFSLDVEGFEMQVLRTIPFNLVNIRVLTVEFIHGAGGSEELISFMESKDYRVVTKLTRMDYLANDVVFVHNSFPTEVGLFPELIHS